MTQDLLELADWLAAVGCTHVAMESTGVYWKPLCNLLEGQFEVLVSNRPTPESGAWAQDRCEELALSKAKGYAPSFYTQNVTLP